MTDDPFGTAGDGSVTSTEDTTDLQKDVEQEETTQLNVEVPVSLKRRIKVKAAETGKDIKVVVREILDKNL